MSADNGRSGVPTWVLMLTVDELTDLACNVYESAVRRRAAVRELNRRRAEARS